MGGIVSMLPSGVSKEWMDIFKAMKLKREEVIDMLAVYNKVDCDKSGNIDVVELLTLLDIERTRFTERIFSAFDKDHTGQIDFYEFTVSVWKFCTLGNGSISVFTFDIFDTDADGMLTSKEVLNMFFDLTGKEAEENEHIRLALVDLTKRSEDGYVHSHDFVSFCKTHQALLARPFAVQDKLRTTTLGAGGWEEVSERRITVRPGMTIPLCELMTLHSNRDLFKSIMNDQTAMKLEPIMRTVLENTDNAAHHAAATAAAQAQDAKAKELEHAKDAPHRKKKAGNKGSRPADLLH